MAFAIRDVDNVRLPARHETQEEVVVRHYEELLHLILRGCPSMDREEAHRRALRIVQAIFCTPGGS